MGLLQELEQRVISPEGEGEAAMLVVGRVLLQVLNNLRQQVCALHGCARRLKAQGCEVYVQMVVGGQVMQVNSQPISRHLVALLDGVLEEGSVSPAQSSSLGPRGSGHLPPPAAPWTGA